MRGGGGSRGEALRGRMAAVPRLVSIPGQPAREFRVPGKSATVGSDPTCEIALGDPTVSRRHARIEYRGVNYYLSDLGSSNGTYINSHRVTQRAALARGDELRFGASIFTWLAPTVSPDELRRRQRFRVALEGLAVVIAVGVAVASFYLSRGLGGIDLFNRNRATPAPLLSGPPWLVRLN